ncbi:MAG: DUF2065 domain-containing protein [Alphaproteobacteria bacterium]
MTTFFLGVGAALAIEGALYAAFPDAVQGMMRRALDIPAASLRTYGFFALAAGVLVVWLASG